MVLFLDLYKEIESIKYGNSQVHKIIDNYPSCESVDLQLDEISSKLKVCQQMAQDL